MKQLEINGVTVMVLDTPPETTVQRLARVAHEVALDGPWCVVRDGQAWLVEPEPPRPAA